MKWYENQALRSYVAEYKSMEAMNAEANLAAGFGWTIASTSELSQRSGCLRMMTLGLFALVWKPKSRVMATYQRQ